jgi:hypothetical protein
MNHQNATLDVGGSVKFWTACSSSDGSRISLGVHDVREPRLTEQRNPQRVLKSEAGESERRVSDEHD